MPDPSTPPRRGGASREAREAVRSAFGRALSVWYADLDTTLDDTADNLADLFAPLWDLVTEYADCTPHSCPPQNLCWNCRVRRALAAVRGAKG